MVIHFYKLRHQSHDIHALIALPLGRAKYKGGIPCSLVKTLFGSIKVLAFTNLS
ncbi:uncharacterized protein DS421_19g657930 [Arachis hypogaea]|uniref:Uncharacterized protein n=1 Tax=Arachis hypogaea TaxID=3818 RepID=A0A6B9V991_ARAHY|nr:uncharacterized protein DS421_19g657930 [Arachis hypogaea]